MEWKVAKTENGLLKVPEEWLFPRYYEALNLLFRIENALRVFVYIVLKNEMRDKWAELSITTDDAGESTIMALAKKRLSQSKSFGYLGHSIQAPIMHLTSGELIRIITADPYWKLFNNYFYGGKDIIRNKLEEIGAIRNALAHFRPIKEDDVVAIKHNAKHVFMGIEVFLAQVLSQPDVTPTNSPHEWYKELKPIGTDQCVVTLRQSSDENWIRCAIMFTCPIISHDIMWENYHRYDVLTVNTSAILARFPHLTASVSYVTEGIPYAGMNQEAKPKYRKLISAVFSKKMLEARHKEIKDDLTQMFLLIAQESEMVKQDHLARGQLVHSVRVVARAEVKEDKKNWSVDTAPLRTPVTEGAPAEYWGKFGSYGDEFITDATRYPWMPETISDVSLPF